eukprot:gnl/Trimastix_PCT/708.p1 GENE.gnl/Trimastix_PCT/708~~gnl/Trimastix_PCT/708.p1  ORF type:complete len:345 (+),score=42.28 gnl/Trimastix_PCT/708:66-1037(+)
MRCLALLLSFVLLASCLQIDKKSVTVSGISAGAYLAGQLFTAHSKDILGAALIAGGPYYCSRGDVMNAQMQCMAQTWGAVDIQELYDKTKEYESTGQIDPTSNMKGKKVWVYSGTEDFTVATEVSKQGEEYYKHYGADVATEYSVESGHCMPTPSYGNDCGTSYDPYINRCSYSGVEHALKHIFSDIKTPARPDADSLHEFDQGRYTADPGSIFMDDTGYVYIPRRCNVTGVTCRLHVALHGCNQGKETLGDEYARHTMYTDYAEANDLVVLFPQNIKSMDMTNPAGCWDWWGYTGQHYATRAGPQMKAIWKMVQQLLGGYEL